MHHAHHFINDRDTHHYFRVSVWYQKMEQSTEPTSANLVQHVPGCVTHLTMIFSNWESGRSSCFHGDSTQRRCLSINKLTAPDPMQWDLRRTRFSRFLRTHSQRLPPGVKRVHTRRVGTKGCVCSRDMGLLWRSRQEHPGVQVQATPENLAEQCIAQPLKQVKTIIHNMIKV